jgi:DHA1 family bicyclomycin/chloramphenicol resistance-like MFS transporter
MASTDQTPRGETAKPRQLSLTEFVPLMALATAIDAMSIDAMLPALPAIGADFGVTDTTRHQLIIQLMFGGFALGQLIGGPIADSFGRKKAFYLGLSIYLAGTLLALLSPSFEMFLAARVLQGFGASIPLIVLAALVRDQYEGAPMARIMSLIGGVFITVPILAPLFGQGLLLVGPWELIFVMFFVLAVTVTIWFGIRQPETLPVERRTPFRLSSYRDAFIEAGTHRVATSYMVAEGFVFGAFLPYLASAQHIFQDIYGQGTAFVLYFSSLAATLGVAFFANSGLVMRLGMQRLTAGALLYVVALSLTMLAVCLIAGGEPPLWLFMGYLLAAFLGVGFAFGNLNALTMEPLGHIAGIGAAMLGTVSTFLGMACGMLVGWWIDGTVLPLIVGFAVYFALAFLVMQWAEAGRKRMAHRTAQG